MDLKKQLVKISKNHVNEQLVSNTKHKEQAQEYYCNQFSEKVLNAAKTNYIDKNSCELDTTSKDLLYFDQLKQIAGSQRIFLYLIENDTKMLVRWSVNQHE